MDEQARAVGRRVRYWRLRRGFDRKHFADLVGRSVSWLDKIESGERSLLRLPLLERVAEALGVDPPALLDEPAAQRATQCVDAAEVRAIRAALGTYPTLRISPDATVPGIAELSRRAMHLEHAWAASRFTVVAQHLPGLVTSAQLAVSELPAEHQLEAQRVLVTGYRLASSMLLKFGTNHIAWLAADRAMQTALTADDTWALARATRSVARAMTDSGQRPQAIETLLGMADRMRPDVARQSSHLLALHGMLFLAASIAAAQEGDQALALSMHEEATAAARRLEPGHDRHHTFFGQANVDIHRVASLVRLHEGGRALEYARRVDQTEVAALSAERRSNYLLDLTEANTITGDFKTAVRTLSEAERVAPEEVRCRPLAHGLLRRLRNNTRGGDARVVRTMAERAGVEA
ncbi:XRE family transcriptional regulator [Amycolatopsis suaedae]|uniref:XRE family transcriptional regulator n=2 Tax=Amycolatopsis suaedae TaxID=2510978 RepID=A0A4Q7J1N3_9PSEU|nr:XRE family transcriptional regulator [Amycolatopsis suaedae]